MSDFLFWLLHRAPVWAQFIAVVLSVIIGMISFVFVFALIGAALRNGNFVIPVVVLFLIPSYLVLRSYVKDKAYRSSLEKQDQ